MNRFLHSRYFLALAAVIVVACALAYYVIGDVVYPYGNGGLVYGWNGPWLLHGHWGVAAGILLTLAIATFMGYLNRGYNLLRTLTWLHASLFLALQLATPSIMLTLNPGLILAAVIMVSCYLMFDSYNGRDAQKRVFLVFLMLSIGAAVDYSFIAYMLVFWVATAQMRIFSMRTVLASLMGILTPWVILLGFGIVSLDALQMPHFYTAHTVLGARSINWMIGVGAFTAFLGVSAWAQSAIKIISYNAKSRAMMSVLTVTLFFTLLLGIIDFNHLAMILPLLNCCVAMQQGHLFGVIYQKHNSYYVVLTIMIIYLGLFVWRTILCVS